jgi:hypothetical protein
MTRCCTGMTGAPRSLETTVIRHAAEEGFSRWSVVGRLQFRGAREPGEQTLSGQSELGQRESTVDAQVDDEVLRGGVLQTKKSWSAAHGQVLCVLASSGGPGFCEGN